MYKVDNTVMCHVNVIDVIPNLKPGELVKTFIYVDSHGRGEVVMTQYLC